MAWFEAPALRENPPFDLLPEEVTVVSRGEWIWRRDVISLISPKNASTNLVVWGNLQLRWAGGSGTPDPQSRQRSARAGESDDEKVYYHRFEWKQREAWINSALMAFSC